MVSLDQSRATTVTRHDEQKAMPQPSTDGSSQPRPQEAARGEVNATRREPPATAEMMRWADDGGAAPTRRATS
jgi:hypothetical protein